MSDKCKHCNSVDLALQALREKLTDTGSQLSAALAKVAELEQGNARLRREVEDLRDEALAGRSR